MTQEIINLYAKAIGGVVVGVVSWLGNSIAQVVAPDQSWTLWLDRYGLPLVMLAIALYVVKVLYSALRASETARIEDKEHTLSQYRADFQVAMEQRQLIAQKLDEQTSEFKTLNEKFKGCQKSNS